MRLIADRVQVRVPATSANLGPGFDCLGLALGLHDEVEVQALASADVVVEVTGEGAGEVPGGEDHLVVRALRLALDHVGAPQTGLRLTCRNAIPHGRGLGSSAAAVVAGMLAARALVGDPAALDEATVLALATRLEGHPDNVAPAMLGGATVAWCEGDGGEGSPNEGGVSESGEVRRDGAGCAGAVPGSVRAVRLEVHPDVVPVVAVPPERLATARARAVLPASVPHGDAAVQAARSALLVTALQQRPDLLLPATADRLHQEYRRSVMPASLALVDALRARGVAAVVSGAGPSVLALGVRGPGGEVDADAALDDAFGGVMAGWRLLRPGVDLHGARARRLAG